MPKIFSITPGWQRWIYLIPIILCICFIPNEIFRMPTLTVISNFGIHVALIPPLAASCLLFVLWPSRATWLLCGCLWLAFAFLLAKHRLEWFYLDAQIGVKRSWGEFRVGALGLIFLELAISAAHWFLRPWRNKHASMAA